MTQPTSTIQPYTTDTDSKIDSTKAVLELDEDLSTLLPNEFVYLLAHIPKWGEFIEPFYSSDSGNMQLIGKKAETLERSETGLVLDHSTQSIDLKYYPSGTPNVVFFGNEIPLDIGKLRNGIISPLDPYDGEKIYKFNVFYSVEFYSIRHTPNHPKLTSDGMPWEEYKGDGGLKSWPVEYQVEWA